MKINKNILHNVIDFTVKNNIGAYLILLAPALFAQNIEAFAIAWAISIGIVAVCLHVRKSYVEFMEEKSTKLNKVNDMLIEGLLKSADIDKFLVHARKNMDSEGAKKLEVLLKKYKDVN